MQNARNLVGLAVLFSALYANAASVVIRAVEPSLLSIQGGQRVAFVGSGFTSSLFMKIGEWSLLDQRFVSSTRMEGTMPARLRAGTYDAVLVRFALPVATLRNAVEIAPPPQVTSVDPFYVSTLGITEVEVQGRNFREATEIIFGIHKLAEPIFVSQTLIRGKAPALDATEPSGAKLVCAEDTRGRTCIENGVSYVEPARVVSVSPNEVSTEGGTAVIITCTGLRDDTVIYFGSHAVENQTRINDTMISGVAPALSAGEEPGPKSVFAEDWRGRTELKDGVTYVAPLPPQVRSVSPSEVSTEGGTPVTITGIRFREETVISFGAHELVDQNFVSETEITGKAPALSAGEEPGPKSVFAEDSRGRTELEDGVTYVAPPPEIPGPQQIEGSLAWGTARFTWYNPVQYSRIIVRDEGGEIISELPGDATFLELPSGGSDKVKVSFEGVSDENISPPENGIASLFICEYPPPLNGAVHYANVYKELELYVYGGGWTDPDPCTGICKILGVLNDHTTPGLVVTDLAHSLAVGFEFNRMLTTGFTLDEPAEVLELSGFYEQLEPAPGLELRVRLRHIYPDEGFEPFVTAFPTTRTNTSKQWHSVVCTLSDAPPYPSFPAGEYLVDVYAIGGELNVPYFSFADDHRPYELMIPGSPCPPYPLVAVRDMSGTRTLPDVTGIRSHALPFENVIWATFQLQGTCLLGNSAPRVPMDDLPVFSATHLQLRAFELAFRHAFRVELLRHRCRNHR